MLRTAGPRCSQTRIGRRGSRCGAPSAPASTRPAAPQPRRLPEPHPVCGRAAVSPDGGRRDAPPPPPPPERADRASASSGSSGFASRPPARTEEEASSTRASSHASRRGQWARVAAEPRTPPSGGGPSGRRGGGREGPQPPRSLVGRICDSVWTCHVGAAASAAEWHPGRREKCVSAFALQSHAGRIPTFQEAI